MSPTNAEEIERLLETASKSARRIEREDLRRSEATTEAKFIRKRIEFALAILDRERNPDFFEGG